MNSKTVAILFAMLSLGSMLVPGLTLTPASALPVNQDELRDSLLENLEDLQLSEEELNELLERLGISEDEGCTLEITTDKETYGPGETVRITVTNTGNEPLEFPNSALGLEIRNAETGEVYPLESAQVVTTLQPGESRTFEFTYEELVSEIGTGLIEASVTSISGEGCSASTTFTLVESGSD